MTESALIWIVLTPLVGALAVLLTDRWPNLREAVSLIAGGALIAQVMTLVSPVLAGESPSALLVTPVPGVPLALQIEPLGLLFALIAAVLWVATTVYAIGYMRGHGEQHQTRFYAFFAIAISATMGVALAQNLFTLFLFYEILTLSTYPLVAHHGDEQAVRSGRTYLGILLGTSILFLLGATIWTWAAAGTLDFTEGGILNGKIEGPLIGLLRAINNAFPKDAG